LPPGGQSLAGGTWKLSGGGSDIVRAKAAKKSEAEIEALRRNARVVDATPAAVLATLKDRVG